MSEPVIEVRCLNKIYQGAVSFHALHDLDLKIMPGEMIAIMGSSGSGKSTLMNILGCLDRLTSGEYKLQGRSIAAYNDNELALIRNRFLGFVFQNFNLLPRYSALKNVELPLQYSSVSNREREKRATEALQRVGLGSKLSNRPNELSGGQKQRVAVARALVNRPAIIMADEPTGALDTHTGRDIMRLFQQLNREGITLIIVTHEPEIASYCQRVLRMQDGRLIEDRQQEPIILEAVNAE
jgi:putative ABC transport system ATP-binding protein